MRRTNTFVGMLLGLGAGMAGPPSAWGQATTEEPRPELAEADEGWWRLEYLGDYLSIAAASGLVVGMRQVDPVENAAIGPTFDPNDWEAVLDPRFEDQIGHAHLPDTISDLGLAILQGTGLVGVIATEWIPVVNGLDHFDGQLAHDAVVGYLEALSWTLALTEVTKVAVGRLRPDFQDRARRYHCGTLGQTDGACVNFIGEPLSESEWDRGRRSFLSGHASLSFSMATYWSWIIGGRFVWGERATDSTVALGVLMQSALLTTAIAVSSGRVDDGRHHLSDVAPGAAIGFGLATVAYLRHFGFDGLLRTHPDRAEAGVQLSVLPQGLGLAVSGRF